MSSSNDDNEWNDDDCDHDHGDGNDGDDDCNTNPEPPPPPPKGVTIIGTNEPDSLIGTAGSDIIFAAAGNDGLSGGDGNDRLTGGAGNDRMSGGDGNDVFIFRPDDGNDRILDFDATGGNDRINLRLLDIDFADVNQVRVGDDLVLTFDGHTNRIVLDDVASVNANDFLF